MIIVASQVMARIGSRAGRIVAIGASCAVALTAIGCASQTSGERVAAPAQVSDLSSFCSMEAAQAITARISTTRVTVSANDSDASLPGGARYVPAANGLPAFCQLTGSFVTNPETGSTANYLATFPANWNGKYLQLGCSGHCGTFAVSNPAAPFITVTSQGLPGDAIRRGYAVFATDEGHTGMGGGAWALNERGEIIQDRLDDFFYRAQMVLSRMGKEFTVAFYREATGQRRSVSRAYFSGCSGGGRDALVAASYFPEEFDGIIAGSPYANMVGTALQGAGVALAGIRSADADVPAELMARVAAIVEAQCDAVDGVQDGLIQNPAACNFRPERDLPRCEAGRASDACFTTAQIQTVSAYLTAVTDEHGRVVQPGLSVSDLQAALRANAPPADRTALNPWPDDNYPGPGGLWALANAQMKIFVHRNDPEFYTRNIITLDDGGPGEITDFRIVVPRAEVEHAMQAVRMGVGVIPENADNLIRRNGRLLIWSNLSDQLLTPYMATNYYNQLAARHGGYERLQRNVRLFDIPGSIHCSMDGDGPLSFDALGAMEAWVERGEAPNSLLGTLYRMEPGPFPGVVVTHYDEPPVRTMPLCAYPAMARYSGRGDVNDAANWSCPADDRRMLTLGESGRRAGVLSGVAD